MKTIDSIEYEWVEPQFLSSSNEGELGLEETGRLMDAIEANVKGAPYFLWEVDVARLTGMTPATRKLCADRLRQLPDRAIAIVHAKFSQRILVKLVLTAVSMLDRSQRNNAVSFFDDSDSARAWLREYGANYEPVKE